MATRLRFSDRIRVTEPRRVLQLGDIDTPLRNSLWNWILTVFRKNSGNSLAEWPETTKAIAQHFLKVRLDEVPIFPLSRAENWLKSQYDALAWYDVYNLVEFIVEETSQARWSSWRRGELTIMVNAILEEECSGYRFIEGRLAPISTASEVEAIEDALSAARVKGLEGVATHVDTALSLLSLKPTPDYRNSIKESISAVESAARQISGKGGLKDALIALESKGVVLHGSLRAGFVNLYGYTSDDDGIRHAILEEPTVGFDDAKYMLVTCSAFATFLISKAAAAGLFNAN